MERTRTSFYFTIRLLDGKPEPGLESVTQTRYDYALIHSSPFSLFPHHSFSVKTSVFLPLLVYAWITRETAENTGSNSYNLGFVKSSKVQRERFVKCFNFYYFDHSLELTVSNQCTVSFHFQDD